MSEPDEEAPLSPCVRICTLDVGGVCEGCFRTLEEITRWSRLSPGAQRAVLERCRRREERARRAVG